jgi:hypothetical protein
MNRLPFLQPWLRIELLLRSILTTRWDDATWPTVRQQLPRVLRLRSQVARDGWWN